MSKLTDVQFYDNFRSLLYSGAVPKAPESFERAADVLADGLRDGSIVVDEEVRAEYGADWVSELSATAAHIRFEQSRHGIKQPAFVRGCAPDLYIVGQRFHNSDSAVSVYREIFTLERPEKHFVGVRVDEVSRRAWTTWLRADEAAELSENGMFYREWVVAEPSA